MKICFLYIKASHLNYNVSLIIPYMEANLLIQHTTTLFHTMGANLLIQQHFKDSELTHEFIMRSYSKFSRKTDREEIHTRKDGALIAQLRTDHCIRLASYRYRIGKDQDDTCPHCHLEAEAADNCTGSGNAQHMMRSDCLSSVIVPRDWRF